MITDTEIKEYMVRPYGYKKTGLLVLILIVFLVRLSFAEYGQLKLDRTVTTPAGNDRLLINLIGVSKDGIGYDFHSLVWERKSLGVWKTHRTITREELEAYSKHRIWIEDVYSLEPETGYTILKIAEESPSKNSHGLNFTRSWRKWDIVNNKEVQFLRECKAAIEPYVIDEKYRSSVNQAKQRSVYIDVIFGGDEYATIRDKAKKPSDDAVKRIGDNLIKQLENKQIVVYLTSNARTKVSLDERLLVARSKFAKLYLAIQSSTGARDCIRLYTPSREGRYSEMKKWKSSSSNDAEKSLIESIKKLEIDQILTDSSRFADMLSASINESSPSLCTQKEIKRSYTLDNTYQPTILVDLVVSKKDKKSSFLQNEEIGNKLADAISKSVADYLSSSARPNND